MLTVGNPFSKYSHSLQEIRHLCAYLVDLKKASAEEMRKSVLANYSAFIRWVHIRQMLVNSYDNFQSYHSMIFFFSFCGISLASKISVNGPNLWLTFLYNGHNTPTYS
jgi:hypothetical protein